MAEHNILSSVHRVGVMQSTDPGAIGAGHGWFDSSSSPLVFKIRNPGNTAWLDTGYTEEAIIALIEANLTQQGGVQEPIITGGGVFTYTSVAIGVPPVANFTKSASIGDIPLTIQFTDISTNNPTSLLWNFGDGTSSTLPNPPHTYAVAGSYSVTLTATNGAGSNTSAVQIITARVPIGVLPVSSFTFTVSGLAAYFVDNSTPPPITNWLWNFGDGITSTQQNPTHVYTIAGTFTVTLTVTNGAGSNTSSRPVNVANPIVLVASFQTTVPNPAAPLEIQFTDTSNNQPVFSSWDFGDGTTTTGSVRNPLHTYAAAGVYVVSLSAYDGAIGSNSRFTLQSVVVGTGYPGGGGGAVDITTTTLPAGTNGVAYDQPIVATGGILPYEYLLVDGQGKLPTGFYLDRRTGHIKGKTLPQPAPIVPTVTLEANDFAGTSIAQKIKAAIASATPGVATQINARFAVNGGNLNEVITLESNMILKFFDGTYTLDTTAAPVHKVGIIMKDNSKVLGESWNTIIVENNSDGFIGGSAPVTIIMAYGASLLEDFGGIPYTFETFDLEVSNIQFKGVRTNTAEGGNTACIYFGNTHRGFIRDCFFYEVCGYAHDFGGFSFTNKYSKDCYFDDNFCLYLQGQNSATITGENISISRNHFKNPGKRPYNIIGATNTDPIVITLDEPCHIQDGVSYIYIQGVTGNTAANLNGWTVIKLSPTTYSISRPGYNGAGNGTYTGGGLFYGGTPFLAVIDVEPNGGYPERIRNWVCEDNLFDLKKATSATNAIVYQPQFQIIPNSNARINRNTIWGAIDGYPNSAYGIQLSGGVTGMEVSDNYISQINGVGFAVAGSGVIARNNTVFNCGGGGNPSVIFDILHDSEISNLTSSVVRGNGNYTVTEQNSSNLIRNNIVQQGVLLPNVGTPSTLPIADVGGISNFAVKVTDGSAVPRVDTRVLSINVPLIFRITTINSHLPDGVFGAAYTTTIASATGTGAVTWTKTGTLPPGLALNASTGVISGSPILAGVYNFLITATDTTPTAVSKLFYIIVI